MKTIDLNVDIGEGAGFDEALLGVATSANVCLGSHAGSWEITLATIRRCEEAGVRIGAHPGFPDRKGLGRRPPLKNERDAWAADVHEQVRHFRRLGVGAYLKPHGALYNLSADGDPWAGDVVARALEVLDVPLLGLPGTAHLGIAAEAGQLLIREGFADRRYTPSGFLVPRSEAGAVLTESDEVVAQALALAPTVDSLCLHGDTSGCVEFARRLRTALEEAGFEVSA
ncbi:MAG: LamB/YcsF family protein [Fimbriimonadaceae bacterium]|nr:LamB/YcsF family protein [Fimbriimonadaceae bacterium]